MCKTAPRLLSLPPARLIRCTVSACLFKTHVNIVKYLRLDLFSLRVPAKLSMHLSPSRATCPAHFIFLYFVILIIFDVEQG